MIKAITQARKIMTAYHLLHWYWKKNQQFRYNWLETTMNTDTLLASEKYLLGNMCGQIFMT